jgi:hypothetical protein
MKTGWINSLFSRVAPFVFFSLLLCPFLSVNAVAGPISPLYATAPGLANIYVLQGSSVTNMWTKQDPGESPIAVMDTIRTSSQTGAPGAEYTLSGNFTGKTYPGYWEHYDGTTDGNYNYSVDYYGNVYRYTRNWTIPGITSNPNYPNPDILFQTSWKTYSTGITYDPSNNSLWFSAYAGSTIENRSMTGTLLSSFILKDEFGNNLSSPTFLAMDYADGTLWTASRIGNALYQYSRTGYLLSYQIVIDPTNGGELKNLGDPALNGQMYGGLFFGAEFQYPQSTVPIPGAIWLLGTGLLGLGAVGWRRKRG